MADPIDTDAIRTAVWGGDARLIRRLCDEVDRLRAENAALAAALGDIAGMDTLGARRWFATAECASFDPRRCPSLR